ncbi:MAG: acyl-CoA dehydrogenase family protein [Myxococcales bacterium]|nr:acyl-CoA dehydrogenase family protein [Myxococcales bacterium]
MPELEPWLERLRRELRGATARTDESSPRSHGTSGARGASGSRAAREAIDGHVPAHSPLSPVRAFASLSPLVQPLVRYEALDPWDQDTASLPRPLAAYRRAMRSFARAHLAPAALEADAEPHGPAAQTVLRAAARAGLLSDLLPRPLGAGSPRLFQYPLQMQAAIKTEELAAVDGGLMLLLCASGLGVAPLLLSGDLGLVRRYLVPAFAQSLGGEPHVFAYAITEPAAGSDVEEGHGASTYTPGTVATPTENGFRLDGRKIFISGGDIARQVVVFAGLRGEGMESFTAFLVHANDPGYSVVRTELKMGMRASSAAELSFDGVRVPRERVVGKLRGGWALNRATLNMSRLPVAAMGVGFARAATELATEFACRTRLGARLLVDYQDVQLTLARMRAETQAARAMVWHAAMRPQALQREASAAKAHCTDAAIAVTTQAMDLLADHAALHRERVEKIYRDARLTQIFEGTNEINRLAMIEDEQRGLLDTIDRLREEPER